MDHVNDLAGKAKKAAEDHPDQADKAADKAEDIAQDGTGHKHDEHISQDVDHIQNAYDGNTDSPDQQT
ncbi:antitoxin [Streptomyces sp. NPDC055056]